MGWLLETCCLYSLKNLVCLHLKLRLTRIKLSNWEIVILMCCGAHRHGNDFLGWGSKNWTTFRLGKQKFVKNNENNQIQSITLCNIYFSKKGIRSVQWGLRQNPRCWGVFGNFVLKVTLQFVRLLLTVSYGKNWRAGCTSCSSNNFVGGATAPAASPVATPMMVLVLVQMRSESVYWMWMLDWWITNRSVVHGLWCNGRYW